jgi:hypothetical protein
MFWLYIDIHLIIYDLINTTGMTLLEDKNKISTSEVHEDATSQTQERDEIKFTYGKEPILRRKYR